LRLVGLMFFVPLTLAVSSPEKLEPAKSQSQSDQTLTNKSWKLADQSCAASNCHGGFTAYADGRGGHEASVWQTYDTHARAYDVLKSDLAKDMMAVLSSHGGMAVDATKEVRCLACHSSAIAANPTSAVQFGDDGVSCRSCHGEASKWIDAHTDAGLSKFDDAAKRRQAYEHVSEMRFLGEPRLRAETCAGCHVGAKEGVDGLPRREVDHDLIAAGHPRLNFELASQSTRQPRHWRDRPRQDLAAEWAAGQAAAFKSLADLAASSEGGPRLDFAYQECAGCHQPFPDGRNAAPKPPQTLGKMGWAVPYAQSATWLSNGDAIIKGLSEVERAETTKLAAALTRMSAAASDNPAINKDALPKPNADLPKNHDALLAEYYARMAIEPNGPRMEELKRHLSSGGKKP